MRLGNLKMIALFELKRSWNNKLLLSLVLVAPVLSCIVFGFVSYTYPEGIGLTVFVDRPPLAVVSQEIQLLMDEIKEYQREDGSKTFSVSVESHSREKAIKKLNEGKTRGVLIFRQGQAGLDDVKIILDVTDLVVSNEMTQVLLNLLTKYTRKISLRPLTPFTVNPMDSVQEKDGREATPIITPPDISIQTNAWTRLRFFDLHASAIMMVLAMSIPLFLSLITITSERARGTMERIFVTPYRRTEIIGGKILAYSVLAVVIALLVTITLKAIFNIALGNIGLILLATILVGMNGVIFGLLISSLTRTETESIMVGIMCFFAFLGLMTYLVPRETMHPAAKFLSRLLPYTYGIEAGRRINLNGAGFDVVWMDLTVLLLALFVQLSFAIPVLRREIK
jgi:ABC-2 type transport system permease protein